MIECCFIVLMSDHTNAWIGRQTHRQTGRLSDTQTEQLLGRPTNRQTYRLTDRLFGRQTASVLLRQGMDGCHLLTCKLNGGPVWEHDEIVAGWSSYLHDLNLHHRKTFVIGM